MSGSTNRSCPAGPEIWFRIVHSAVPSRNCALLAAYREQEVEVALGPVGVFKDDRIGVLTRRIEADQVVSVVPLVRGNLNQPTGPKKPHVVGLLRKATEWRRQLDTGEVRNQAEIARREGVTRARVTQVMGMLRLAPEIQEHIQSMPETHHRPPVTERTLRPIESISDYCDQLREFHKVLVQVYRLF